jgi:uridine phosphorylase
VLEELCDLGLQRAIRVGTCGALDAGLRHGELVIADRALAADGTSRALGAGERVSADAGLVAALRAAAGDGARCGTVVTSDLFYDREPARARAWMRAGAIAIEMEAATILRVAELRGIAAACVLAVSDTFHAGARRRIGAAVLQDAVQRLGRAAADALG